MPHLLFLGRGVKNKYRALQGIRQGVLLHFGQLIYMVPWDFLGDEEEKNNFLMFPHSFDGEKLKEGETARNPGRNDHPSRFLHF